MKRVGRNLPDRENSVYIGSEPGRSVACPIHVAAALKDRKKVQCNSGKPFSA